jgi:hypothetical protein
LRNDPIAPYDRGETQNETRLVGFGLSLLLLLNSATSAQNAKTSSDEWSAVRASVTNNIEAHYQGDANRMQQTLHPRYLKHAIHGSSR